jgi:hypothetical protein
MTEDEKKDFEMRKEIVNQTLKCFFSQLESHSEKTEAEILYLSMTCLCDITKSVIVTIVNNDKTIDPARIKEYFLSVIINYTTQLQEGFRSLILNQLGATNETTKH